MARKRRSKRLALLGENNGGGTRPPSFHPIAFRPSPLCSRPTHPRATLQIDFLPSLNQTYRAIGTPAGEYACLYQKRERGVH